MYCFTPYLSKGWTVYLFNLCENQLSVINGCLRSVVLDMPNQKKNKIKK